MNQLLNGTGWGELPRQEQELLIPDFMSSDYKTYSLVVPHSAYRAQGMGRVKRQVRQEQKRKRDLINGLFFTGASFGLLVLANILTELICR